MRSSIWLSVLLIAGLAQAADLRVYSEFRRIALDGEIVKADQGGRVREILSPMAVRGGYSTYRIVVEAPPGEEFWLYIGQNPDDNAQATLYREVHQDGRPDALEKVEQPYKGQVAAGAKVATFLLDLFYRRSAAVERVKIEPQLHIENRWIIYPMEVRVTSAVLPSSHAAPARYPGTDAGQRAETPAFTALRETLCGAKPPAMSTDLTARRLMYRNARQDLALAATLPALKRAELLPEAKGFCGGTLDLPWEGWLRMREQIYRALAPAVP
jgi:hypothetical protein